MSDDIANIGISITVNDSPLKELNNKLTATDNLVRRLTKTEIEMAQVGVQAFSQMGSAVTRVQTALINHAKVTDNATKSNSRFGMYAQQVGYQVGDFFVQVQSGTNALMAFGQQGTQLAGLLPGVYGAIVGIGLAIGTALGGSLIRANVSLSETIDYFGSMGPIVESLANAFIKAGTIIIDTLNLIINNFDRVIAYAAAAAIFFGGPFVAAMIASALSVGSLSSALLFLRGALIKTGIGVLIIAAGELIYQFTKLVEGAGGFGKAMAIISEIAIESMDRIKIALSMLAPVTGIVTNSIAIYFSNMWNSILKTATMPLQWMQDKLLDLDDALNGPLKGRGTAKPVTFDTTDTSGLVDNLKRNQEVLAGLKDQFNAPMASLDAFMEAMKKADEEGKQIDIRDWFGGVASDKSSGSSVKDKLKEISEELKIQQGIWDTVGSSMSDAFMSMVDGTKSAKDAFKSMALAIIKELYNVLVVQRMVGSFNATTGVGSGIVGAIAGGLAGGFGGSLSSGRNSGYVSGMAGRANGGPISAGTPYMVGERGPEMIIPKSSGMVLTNGQTKTALGGSSNESYVVHNNISVTGSDSMMVRQEIAKMIPQISSATKAAMIDAKRRGGQMGNAFR